MQNREPSTSISNRLSLRFGAIAGSLPQAFYAGTDDETRTSAVARSTDAIGTDYATQAQGANAITVGNETST